MGISCDDSCRHKREYRQEDRRSCSAAANVRRERSPEIQVHQLPAPCARPRSSRYHGR